MGVWVGVADASGATPLALAEAGHMSYAHRGIVHTLRVAAAEAAAASRPAGWWHRYRRAHSAGTRRGCARASSRARTRARSWPVFEAGIIDGNARLGKVEGTPRCNSHAAPLNGGSVDVGGRWVCASHVQGLRQAMKCL